MQKLSVNVTNVHFIRLNEIVCINTSSRLNLFVLIAITDIDPKFIFGKVVIWLFELSFMPVIMMFSNDLKYLYIFDLIVGRLNLKMHSNWIIWKVKHCN